MREIDRDGTLAIHNCCCIIPTVRTWLLLQRHRLAMGPWSMVPGIQNLQSFQFGSLREKPE
jgi:hypothetical protein